MNDNVFSLNVPVNDVFFMQVVKGAADLSDNASDLWLLERSSLSHFLVEISRFAELHDKVNVFVSAKSTIKLDNVGMVKFHVDFNFPDEGLFINLIENSWFEDLFEGIKWSSEFMLSHINRTEGSLPTEIENFEVING